MGIIFLVDKDLKQTELLRNLFDASVDGILAFDRDCCYTAWNAVMERISGLKRAEVLGRVAFDVFPFLKETGEDRYFHQALSGGFAVSEARPYTVPETGHSGLFDGHYSPLRDERGEIIGGVAIIRDVTASRLSEEARRASEERYRAFIANSSEGIWRLELEQPVSVDLPADDQIELFYRYGYLAECNDAMARMYGYARAEEITGARCGDLLVRGDPKNVDYLRAFIASGYRLTEAESVEVDREGRTRTFSNNLVGVIENGLLLRGWGTQRDITERKEITKTAAATEHRFLMFMENLPGLAWIKDSQGQYVYVNESAAQAFGLQRKQIIGKTDDDIFAPETAAKFRENDRQALSSDTGILTIETLQQVDGVHHSIVSKFPIPTQSGESMVCGVAIDVTERIRAQEALRQSEEKYRGLLENANDLIYSHDLKGNYLTINRACEAVTGYTREEILGGLNLAQVVVPEHLELARRMIELKLRDPLPTLYDVDILTKDGRRLTLEVSTRVSQSDGHEPIIEGVARDVTDRKRSEIEREELLKREQRARLAAEEALNVARSLQESLTVLVEASGLLLGSPSLEDVQPAILNLSRRLISSDAYAIWRGDPKTKTWRITSSAGLSEEYCAQIIKNWPAEDVLNKPLIAEEVETLSLLENRRQLYLQEGICSLLAVPMRIHGDGYGTLTYYYRQPRQFTDNELHVATALANLASAAIGNAELYDEQRQLRAKAQESEWRSNFLAEASKVLSSSLNFETTLARVVRLAVPDLADWCAVDIVEGHHSLRRLAVAHVDPTKVDWAHEIQKRYPPDMDAETGVPHVLRSGESEIYPEVTDKMIVDAARDEEHLRLLRGIGISSAMLVPLVAHGRTHGVITFITAESERRYGSQDLLLAEAIARRVAVAVENARLYEAAQNASRLKDEFLATVSHELRTPLTAILGWAVMLRSNGLDEAGAYRALETIERNARNQQQIIEDLLDVSSIITGKLLLETRSVELAPLIEASVESLSPAAQAKDIHLHQELDRQLQPVQVDPARFQQILWNLLSNAIKFTPAGGSVTTRLERVDGNILITVSDTGQGISSEFLPFVFERFRQADSTTTRKYGGLGLGLAIVRHLVELHGGSVEADSQGEGRGSTFTVHLPIGRIDQRIDNERKTQVSGSDQLSNFESAEELRGLKVLVVDDDPDTCELIRASLERCSAQVVTVQSAREALTELQSFRPDILISDIGMPEEDGYELIRQVRLLPKQRGGAVPAVALTAYARVEDRLRVVKEGYQMHLSKPVELAELITVVASLAGGRNDANEF